MKPFGNVGVQRLFSARSRGRLQWQLLSSSAEEVAQRLQLDPIPSEEEPEENRRRRIEAVLLIAREPLPSRRLAQLTGLADATEARTLTRRLNEIYDRQGRAMRIEEVAGGFQLMTRPQFAKWLRRLEHVPGELRLTQPSLETLALVAYRQPILRADLEAIRGVGSGEVLRQLMQRDLVRICGRSEELGRPYLYGTTRRFLQLFGLQKIERLPRAEWVRQMELNSSALSADDQISVPMNDHSPRFLFGSETKESTVKMSVATNGLMETLEGLVDPRLSPRFNAMPMAASDEDSDEDDLDDDEEEDLDDDEDEEFEDDEEELEEEFDDDEDEDEEGEAEGEEEWEEVEGDEEEDEGDEEEDEEWDDEEGDDWDDDDEDDDDEEEEEEADWD